MGDKIPGRKKREYCSAIRRFLKNPSLETLNPLLVDCNDFGCLNCIFSPDDSNSHWCASDYWNYEETTWPEKMGRSNKTMSEVVLYFAEILSKLTADDK